MIVLAVLEGVLLLMLIFLRQRIRIAIALLKEASRSGPSCEGEGTLGRGAGLDGGIGIPEEKGRNVQWLTVLNCNLIYLIYLLFGIRGVGGLGQGFSV